MFTPMTFEGFQPLHGDPELTPTRQGTDSTTLRQPTDLLDDPY